MVKCSMLRYNSIQTLGTLDGPGVRFVIFLQGCPLRCAYCHNPDTWDCGGGIEISVDELMARILRFRPYFGKDGGVTVSGGEPLLQAQGVEEVFRLCRALGIHTALDTSGCMLNAGIKSLLEWTDLVLLDIKMTTDVLYRKYIGCELQQILDFYDYLCVKKIQIWVRQVIIEGINDDAQNIERLKLLLGENVVRVQLLPFRKICVAKYDNLGIDFLLSDYPETAARTIDALSAQISTEKYIYVANSNSLE